MGLQKEFRSEHFRSRIKGNGGKLMFHLIRFLNPTQKLENPRKVRIFRENVNLNPSLKIDEVMCI
jgi:hypothetical protein